MTDPTPRPPAGTDLATFKETLARAEAIPGCADNSCVWRPSSGMGTNGGCRCSDGRQGPRIIRWAGWIRRELPALLEEVERLRAEVAELRLVLAAEQGRQEGAPGAGWEYDPAEHSWRRCATGRGWSCVYRDRNSTDGISEWGSDSNRGAPAPNMRAAMQAADAAEAEAAAKEPTP